MLLLLLNYITVWIVCTAITVIAVANVVIALLLYCILYFGWKKAITRLIFIGLMS